MTLPRAPYFLFPREVLRFASPRWMSISRRLILPKRGSRDWPTNTQKSQSSSVRLRAKSNPEAAPTMTKVVEESDDPANIAVGSACGGAGRSGVVSPWRVGRLGAGEKRAADRA